MTTDYFYPSIPNIPPSVPVINSRRFNNLSPLSASPTAVQASNWRSRQEQNQSTSSSQSRSRNRNTSTTSNMTNTESKGHYNNNNSSAGDTGTNKDNRYQGNRYYDDRRYNSRYYDSDYYQPSYWYYQQQAGNSYYDSTSQYNNGYGYNFQGSNLVVEPSVASTTKKRNSPACKIFVSNAPPLLKPEELHNMILRYGNVINLEKSTSRDLSASGLCYIVTTDNVDNAQSIVQGLNTVEFDGLYLKADYLNDGRRRRGGQRSGMAPLTQLSGTTRQTDFPLRILVQSDMVGAIIGRQGSTIRQITQQSHARVDVHRKENLGSVEKAITIYGNPENCTSACKRILEVMHIEANNTDKGSVGSGDDENQSSSTVVAATDGNNSTEQQQQQPTGNEEQINTNNKVGSSSEITLKILAHNNLIGRIIGKGGQTIKRIMSDTETKITVSSINDISSFNLERTITVKGSIENMSKAEALISQKLRQSYENDLQAMTPQSVMFPGLHPMAMMSTASMNYGSRNPAVFNTSHTPFPFQSNPAAQPGPTSDIPETAYLYIPNSSVGAIIGTKGSHIRNIIRFSGAAVKIAQLDSDKPIEASCERKVTVTGTPEAQWKAQYLIYEKMREEGFAIGNEEVRLTVEILVPSAQVGRIIGKGGQNVRELQRVTGSIIKLSEQTTTNPSENDETTVHILGPFFSVQSAQRRIRSMVTLPGFGLIPAATGRSRNTSQEGGARSRRDGSTASQPAGTVTPQQQQQQQQQASSQSSPSSQASSGQAAQQQQQQQAQQ